MQIKIETTFEIDIAAERARIEASFKDEIPEAKARQVVLLDLFESRKWREFMEKFENLPYNDEDGCYEKEYVPTAIVDFLDFLFYSGNDSRIVP